MNIQQNIPLAKRAKVSALECGTASAVLPPIPTTRPLMASHLLKPVCEWTLEEEGSPS